MAKPSRRDATGSWPIPPAILAGYRPAYQAGGCVSDQARPRSNGHSMGLVRARVGLRGGTNDGRLTECPGDMGARLTATHESPSKTRDRGNRRAAGTRAVNRVEPRVRGRGAAPWIGQRDPVRRHGRQQASLADCSEVHEGTCALATGRATRWDRGVRHPLEEAREFDRPSERGAGPHACECAGSSDSLGAAVPDGPRGAPYHPAHRSRYGRRNAPSQTRPDPNPQPPRSSSGGRGLSAMGRMMPTGWRSSR